MTSPTFFDEFTTRASFVGAIALSNPVILTFYVFYARSGPGALEFWAAGMALIALTCLISLIVVALMVRKERARRVKAALVRKRADNPDPKATAGVAQAANRG